jgi:pimeloyl-ACP methyl ester carboxylesterase
MTGEHLPAVPPVQNEPESPPREPCPPPLEWHNIAQKFHSSAESILINAGDAELKVTRFGEGRPIVFLPLTGGTARLFCLTAWLLKDQYRSLIFDPPLWRKRPSVRHLVSRSAEAFSMALEHLCPEGADVYAPLFSSQVALAIMAQSPKVIRSAFLQTAWAHREFTLAERALLSMLSVCPLRLRRLPLWQRMAIENHRRWFPPFDETRFGFLLQELGETPACDAALALLASTKTDLSPQLSTITQPVLVLHCEGEGEGVARAEAILEEKLRNVQREDFYHSGHFPFLTHPQRLIKVIKPFWPSQVTNNSGEKPDVK